MDPHNPEPVDYETAALSCPLCAFVTMDSYVLSLHIEEVHFAEDSPFVAQDATSSSQQNCLQQQHSVVALGDPCDEWIPCQEDACGELVLWKDLQEHLYLHGLERADFDAASVSTVFAESTRDQDSEHDPHSGKNGLSRSSVGATLVINAKQHAPVQRCGKAELGPYAFESKMPDWLYDQLSKGGKVKAINRIGSDGRTYRHEFIENEACETIPALSRLLDQDSGTELAYLCHSAVRHVFKLPSEGAFCGYRNIQMLVSYIRETRLPGSEKFQRGLPGILDLQDMIETAWDAGVQIHGKIETGGIRGTRKYIGTPEAQALFEHLGTPSQQYCCSDSIKEGQAHEQLLRTVADYFSSHVPQQSQSSKVTFTNAPPIYMQQPGHSLTIIGFEKLRSGGSNLLVFDPSYGPPMYMRYMLGMSTNKVKSSRSRGKGAKTTSGSALSKSKTLESYRRGPARLKRHKDFELLLISPAGSTSCHIIA